MEKKQEVDCDAEELEKIETEGKTGGFKSHCFLVLFPDLISFSLRLPQ